jgi:hypothetical protein
MEWSKNLNIHLLTLGYSAFLVVVLFIWNPLDSEDGIKRFFSAVGLIIVAAILGMIRRAIFGPNLWSIEEEE